MRCALTGTFLLSPPISLRSTTSALITIKGRLAIAEQKFLSEQVRSFDSLRSLRVTQKVPFMQMGLLYTSWPSCFAISFLLSMGKGGLQRGFRAMHIYSNNSSMEASRTFERARISISVTVREQSSTLEIEPRQI